MTHIYHITSRAAAQDAQKRGEYRAESLETQGFIHFSQSFQVLNVANSFYTGQTDLVILVVEPARLKAELRFEAPVHPSNPAPAAEAPTDAAALFPHLYGPLNFDAVLRMVPLPLNAQGKFDLPSLD